MKSEPQAWRLKLTVRIMREGGVIACPTEGVWGLSCLPDNEYAVARVLELKQRSWKQGLIMVASSIDQVEHWLPDLDAGQLESLNQTWPGPVTWLVPDNGRSPRWVIGEHDKVAIRVSAHPVLKGICDALGGPIVSTSANPTGKPPALCSLKVRQYFPGGIDHLVPGRLGGLKGASEIRDLVTGAIVRPG